MYYKFDRCCISYSTDPVELREWLLLYNVQHQSLVHANVSLSGTAPVFLHIYAYLHKLQVFVVVGFLWGGFSLQNTIYELGISIASPFFVWNTAYHVLKKSSSFNNNKNKSHITLKPR